MRSTIFGILFLLAGALAKDSALEGKQYSSMLLGRNTTKRSLKLAELHKRSSESEINVDNLNVTDLTAEVKEEVGEVVGKVEDLIYDVKETVLDILEKMLTIPGLSGIMNMVPLLPEIVKGEFPITSLSDLFELDKLAHLVNALLPIDILSLVPQIMTLVKFLQDVLEVPLQIIGNLVSTILSTIKNVLSALIPIS